jgi:hypothetical protein
MNDEAIDARVWALLDLGRLYDRLHNSMEDGDYLFVRKNLPIVLDASMGVINKLCEDLCAAELALTGRAARIELQSNMRQRSPHVASMRTTLEMGLKTKKKAKKRNPKRKK